MLADALLDPAKAAAHAAGSSLGGIITGAARADVLLVYRYRRNPSLAYGDWSGSTFLCEDGRLDGITRTRLAPACMLTTWPR